MNFNIRGYSSGDEYKILEMFNEVFGQHKDIDYWYWKYKHNPYGYNLIALAETTDGILAAHYAGYPVKVYFQLYDASSAREFTTYQVGDKMTRKRFRGGGFGKSSLLARTAYHFYATYCKEKVPFFYGFVTHHSQRLGVLFLKYITIEPIPYRVLSIVKLNNFSKSIIEKLFTDIRVSEVKDIDERWTEFFYRVAPHYKYLTIRDATYLKWRYLQRPDRKYLILSVTKKGKIMGWSVFYRETCKIIWGDALFNPGDLESVKSMFKYLKRHPISNKADFIECWFPPRPEWWDTLLQILGFKMEVEPNKLHFAATIFDDQETPEMLKKYFYYSMGDSDLF